MKNYDEIMSELNSVFQRVFDNPKISVTSKTTASDIKEWDSLTHMNLIVEIENHFAIEFEFDEVVEFRNVGEVAVAIKKKVN